MKVADNLADVIEVYLKGLIDAISEEEVELSRRELSTRFRCAPSQISYVLSTRFTPTHGYIVETKRGGGGFIKILKTGWEMEENIFSEIQDGLEEADAENFLSKMYRAEVIDKSDLSIVKNILKETVMDVEGEKERAEIRAKLLKALLSYILHTRSENK